MAEGVKLNESILKQWQAQALGMKPYHNKNFPPSPYYRFLKILAQNIHPRLSIELGVCGGGGSLHLAMGWQQGIVVGVDNQDDHRENINYILNKYQNFRFWIGDSVNDARSIADYHGKVDILFIDTVHTYERTMLEYETWLEFMADDYIICFDDLFRPGMSQLWSELPNPKLRLDYLHDGAGNGGGFGVIWNG